jgi:hypothetical protein
MADRNFRIPSGDEFPQLGEIERRSINYLVQCRLRHPSSPSCAGNPPAGMHAKVGSALVSQPTEVLMVLKVMCGKVMKDGV